MRKLSAVSTVLAALMVASALSGCGGSGIEPASSSFTVSSDAQATTDAEAAAEAAEAEAAEAAAAEAAEPPPAQDVYYKNCTAARAAGVTPIMRGEPGYASHLDRDNDGIACE